MKKRSKRVLVLLLLIVSAGAAFYFTSDSVGLWKNGNEKTIEKTDGDTKEPALASDILKDSNHIAKNTKPASKLRVLYDKYKHVEKIYLRDGTIMFGVMYEKNAGINFITPDGTLNLLKDDIVRVVYMKPESL